MGTISPLSSNYCWPVTQHSCRLRQLVPCTVSCRPLNACVCCRHRLCRLNSREMLREKVAKGAWHLSNIANPPSIQPTNSTSELHPKISHRVLRPKEILTRPLLSFHIQSLRPDGGITVSVETITEYATRYPRKVSFRNFYMVILFYSLELTSAYWFSTASRSTCLPLGKMKSSNSVSEMMQRLLPQRLVKYNIAALFVWDDPLLSLLKGSPRAWGRFSHVCNLGFGTGTAEWTVEKPDKQYYDIQSFLTSMVHIRPSCRILTPPGSVVVRINVFPGSPCNRARSLLDPQICGQREALQRANRGGNFRVGNERQTGACSVRTRTSTIAMRLILSLSHPLPSPLAGTMQKRPFP